jgi:5-oxoprolinase (ATP-hydrolysing) subunit C
MSAAIRIVRSGPLATLQDAGRPSWLAIGVGASGPMDRAAFARAELWVGAAGPTGIEFTMAGLCIEVEGGPVSVAADGGQFSAEVNGVARPWPLRALLKPGDRLDIRPGPYGNYGYLRFDREIEVPPVLGSRATNTVVGLGGIDGRALQAGDRLPLCPRLSRRAGPHPTATPTDTDPIRVIWGLHADQFGPEMRNRFVTESFRISPRIDRMGARLADPAGVFGGLALLGLVSDAIVPGDIQILGDGTPVVLLRDHQPTGGYPRIATIVSADFDRFAQLRPGSDVRFQPVTVAAAHALLGARP